MRSLTPQDIAGKKVFLRCDFNVSLQNGQVGDISRIRMTLPTIQFLLDHDATIILSSHLGRPQGVVDDTLRLAPIHRVLEQELKRSVWYNGQIISEELEDALAQSKPGDIFLLENIQFDPGECDNSPEYARALAALADVYVNDAFAQAHRNYASLVGITKFLPSVPGLLMEKEIAALTDFMENIQAPGVIVMGGVKIETKLPVIKNLINYADVFLFGGGIANTLLHAAGYEIGASLAEKDRLAEAQDILLTIEQEKDRYLLPIDAKVSDAHSQVHNLPLEAVEPTMRIMDIGTATEELFLEEIAKANTIVWNGPLGYIEDPQFCHSTKRIITAIANSKAATLVGGGDTLDTLEKFNIDHDLFTHVSSGGGAMLSFLEGTPLPAITALEQHARMPKEIDTGWKIEEEKLWKEPLPVEEIPLTDLDNNLDIKYLESLGTDDWNLTPRELLNNFSYETAHAAKVEQADLHFPLDIYYFNGQWIILDGVHRFVKAHHTGHQTIQVRRATEEVIERCKKTRP